MLTQDRRPNMRTVDASSDCGTPTQRRFTCVDERTRMGLIFPLMTPLIC
jgi:hypothetical protein